MTDAASANRPPPNSGARSKMVRRQAYMVARSSSYSVDSGHHTLNSPSARLACWRTFQWSEGDRGQPLRGAEAIRRLALSAYLRPSSRARGVAAHGNGAQQALEEHPPVVRDGLAGGGCTLPCVMTSSSQPLISLDYNGPSVRYVLEDEDNCSSGPATAQIMVGAYQCRGPCPDSI